MCGDNTSTELAHLRYSEYKSGKVNPGMGKKPNDIWTMPLCSYHHRMQHSMNEREFWINFKLNPVTYCTMLKCHSGDINKLPEIVKKSQVKLPVGRI